MKKPICKCGLRKNGVWWHQVNGKFVNEATFMDALYETIREDADIVDMDVDITPISEEADIAAVCAVITPATVCKPTPVCKPATVCKPTWNYDISPALLLVIGVVVLVFVMVLLGIRVGDAELESCGKFKPWGNNGVIWFVENTCWGVGSVR